MNSDIERIVEQAIEEYPGARGFQIRRAATLAYVAAMREAARIAKAQAKIESHSYGTVGRCALAIEASAAAIDGWDDMDWETFCDVVEFRKRRDELRQEGKLP